MALTAVEMQAKIEKLELNMLRLDAIVNGPATGDESSVEVDTGTVPTLARALNLSGGTTAMIPTLDAVVDLEIPSNVTAIQVAGRTSPGDGYAGVYAAASTAPTHDNWIADKTGRIFVRSTPRGGVLKLSDYLDLYKNRPPAYALLKACQQMWRNGSKVSMLDCEGIEILITEPFRLDSTNITVGATSALVGNTIANLVLRAAEGSTWAADTALFAIHGNETTGTKIRSANIQNCVFDGIGLVPVAFEMAQYYHLSVANCVMRGFTKYGGYSKRTGADLDTGDGAHGLVWQNNDVLGKGAGGTEAGFNAQPQCGLYLEDGDVAIEGGWISWTQKGIYSGRGGLHINKIHLSLSDGPTPKIGIDVTAPRSVYITGCDMDGCTILLRNPTTNWWSPGSSVTNWRRVSIVGNEFSVSGNDAASGLIVFRTITPNTKIVGLNVTGNVSADGSSGDIRTVQFGTLDSGSWDSGMEGVILNPGGKAANFPGANFIARTEAAWIYQTGGAGRTVIGSGIGTNCRAYFNDPANGGAKMPFVGSSGNELYLGANGDELVRLSIEGNVLPVADGTQRLGSTAKRWASLYAVDGTIRTSDRRYKHDIRPLNDAEIEAARDLSRLVRAYKMNGARVRRTHVGWVAQDIVDAFAKHGLDAHEYGLISCDEIEGGVLYGVRYDEVMAFVTAAMVAEFAR